MSDILKNWKKNKDNKEDVLVNMFVSWAENSKEYFCVRKIDEDFDAFAGCFDLFVNEVLKKEAIIINGYEDKIIHFRDGFMPSVGTVLYRLPKEFKDLIV